MIVSSTVTGLNEIDDTSQDIRFSDPGFQTITEGNPDDYEFNGSASGIIDFDRPTTAYSSFKTTLSVMTGISSGDVRIGMPKAFRYIFSFIFFWIPIFMMIWSLYMAIPILH